MINQEDTGMYHPDRNVVLLGLLLNSYLADPANYGWLQWHLLWQG